MAQICAMEPASAERVRVIVEVEFAEPPQGRLTDEDGAVRPFEGWLELMDGLHQAIARASRSPTEERS